MWTLDVFSLFGRSISGNKFLRLSQRRLVWTILRLSSFLLRFAPHWYDGLAYQQYEGLIEGGFAFKVAPLVFYGQQSDGLVNVLGVKIVSGDKEQGKELAAAVQKWMSASDLLLVDWCKMQLIPANMEMIEGFFMC